MCTAISMDGLFGRTLDLEYSYDEAAVVVPRNFKLNIECIPAAHIGFVGMAHLSGGFPLMYDGMNEYGLCAAALNFPGCAVYNDDMPDRHNIASFEVIPLVLAGCGTVGDALELLKYANITGRAFSAEYPATPLHWIIADKECAVTVEQTSAGIAIHENSPGVMTNSPQFPIQLARLADHMNISPYAPRNNIAPGVYLPEYTRGMGALGLPGDFSSGSRFVRAAFAANNSQTIRDKESAISQFFHIMDVLGVPRGLCRLEDGKSVITVYTSCCDMTSGMYYFTTYDCRSIRGVKLHARDMTSDELKVFPAAARERIMYLN